MGILDKINPPQWLSGLVAPIAGLIDNLSTSKEEKMQLENEMTVLLTEVVNSILQYEEKLADARSKIIIAEAQGESWLQRNWRPMLMTNFGFVITWNYAIVPIVMLVFDTKVPPIEMPADMWDVLKLGVGGYIVGRSGEKITKTIMERRSETKK